MSPEFVENSDQIVQNFEKGKNEGYCENCGNYKTLHDNFQCQDCFEAIKKMKIENEELEYDNRTRNI